MNAGKGKRDMGKSIEMRIAGHPVRLSFAKEADTTVAQRVRNSLIDAYICQNAAGRAAAGASSQPLLFGNDSL